MLPINFKTLKLWIIVETCLLGILKWKKQSLISSQHVWCIHLSSITGAKRITRKVPDTITSWVLKAFAFSSAKGLGVAPNTEVWPFSYLQFLMHHFRCTIFHQMYSKTELYIVLYRRVGKMGLFNKLVFELVAVGYCCCFCFCFFVLV